MRKPTESLDNFIGKSPSNAERPPRRVSLISMRKFEVVKPLAAYEATPKRKAPVSDPSLRRLPLGRSAPSYPSFAMAAAFAVMIMILASAVLIGINEPVVEQAEFAVDQAISSTEFAVELSDLGADQLIPDAPVTAEGASTSEVPSTSKRSVRGPLRFVRSAVEPRRAKRSSRLTAYRTPRPRPRLVQVTDIVPTTLVIYPEDGEIKTRIEFQVSGLYGKPLTEPSDLPPVRTGER